MKLSTFICIFLIRLSVGYVNLVSQYSDNSPALYASRIALTRERGTNDKLQTLLREVECHEIPCIKFEKTEERRKIIEEIQRNDFVILTSPQAASVFVEEWKAASQPKVRVVALGKGTSKPLHVVGIQSEFEPEDSTAESLAKELPFSLGAKVLYPCSALADDTIPDALRLRGFYVTRLSTYTTVPAPWTDDDYTLARSMDIVTFGSPSTVRVWKERVGIDMPAVAIGITSYNAAVKQGFKEVYYPPGASKGLEPWAKTILQVARKMEEIKR
eukprot:gene3716-3971_t